MYALPKVYRCQPNKGGWAMHVWKPRQFIWKFREAKKGNWRNDCGRYARVALRLSLQGR